MSEILILISKKLKNTIPPKLGYFKRGSEEVTWFPVIAISESSSMGVSETGEWVVQVAEGIHHLDNPHLYVYVIALLERPYKDVLDDIVDVFQKNSIDETPSSVFPFVEIASAGLSQRSDYWVKLAFDWFGFLPKDEKNNLKGSLIRVMDAKWTTQKNRQRAKMELNRINEG